MTAWNVSQLPHGASFSGDRIAKQTHGETLCDVPVYGNVLASMPQSFEVMRFTRVEYDRGDTVGWNFAAGWFQCTSGEVWGWFSRETEETEKKWK